MARTAEGERAPLGRLVPGPLRRLPSGPCAETLAAGGNGQNGQVSRCSNSTSALRLGYGSSFWFRRPFRRTFLARTDSVGPCAETFAAGGNRQNGQVSTDLRSFGRSLPVSVSVVFQTASVARRLSVGFCAETLAASGNRQNGQVSLEWTKGLTVILMTVLRSNSDVI